MTSVEIKIIQLFDDALLSMFESMIESRYTKLRRGEFTETEWADPNIYLYLRLELLYRMEMPHE